MSRINQVDLGPTAAEIENSISLVDVINKYTRLKASNGKHIGLCPFHNEKTPSFTVSQSKGIYKCFGCGEGGKGVINFIMNKEKLSFSDARALLLTDFKVTSTKKDIIIRPEKETEPLDIEFVDMPFTKQHNKYWEKLRMDQTFLNKNNVFAVKEWAIGRKKKGTMRIKPKEPGEITFCYYAPDINGEKILRIGPTITKADKWVSNIKSDYLWYFDQYEQCNDLYIVKSLKDTLVVKKLGYCAVAVQSENARVLLDKNKERIEAKCVQPTLVFGIDTQAIGQRDIILSETDWKSWRLNESLYESHKISDAAEYIEAGFNYKQLRQELLNGK